MLLQPLAVAAWLLHGMSGALALATPQPQRLHARAEDLRLAAADLKPQLSKAAVVTSPNDPAWDDLLIRGTSPRVSPDYSVVVEVATESDVVKTIQIANRYNVPFLAVSGTHGWTETLNRVKNGIQIRMRKLNSTTVDKGGKTATVGGGTLQYEITRSLFAQGKYTVTGLAECVSAIGPLMGGGHSLLQGQHGFALDNLVSARVALGNGTVVEASSSKNADLFWALRGAGHNYGIVTSFQVKAYDIPKGDQGLWTVYALTYKQDKLEALFSLINKIEASKTRPTKLALTGVFAKVPDVDASPVIAYTIAYEGPQSQAEPYASQFKAIGPVSTTVTTNIPYGNLYTITGNSLDSVACKKNQSLTGNGVSLPKWDLPGLRKAHTLFEKAVDDPRFNTSVVLLENYGMEGVRKVDPATTALPPEERANPILTSPILWWIGTDPQTKKDALAINAQIKDALYSGVDAAKGKRHAYTNYAIGTESLPEIYGYEAWRLQKLKGLKKAYDPLAKYKFFNPIPSA